MPGTIDVFDGEPRRELSRFHRGLDGANTIDRSATLEKDDLLISNLEEQMSMEPRATKDKFVSGFFGPVNVSNILP